MGQATTYNARDTTMASNVDQYITKLDELLLQEDWTKCPELVTEVNLLWGSLGLEQQSAIQEDIDKKINEAAWCFGFSKQE
jgi:hypothetical protein